MVHIYALVETGKDIGEVRYIGITSNPIIRLTQHRQSTENNDKGKWVSALRDEGKTVDMILLDTATSRDEAHIKENAWILFARTRGWSLTNSTDPGEHRAILEPEIRNLEDVIVAMSVLKTETNERIDRLMTEMKGVDSHFQRWYQIAMGFLLGIPSLALSVWLVSVFPFFDSVNNNGYIYAISWVVGLSVSYPWFAFILWYILKEIPFYRKKALSKGWIEGLDEDQYSAYNSFKRIVTNSILGIILTAIMFWLGG